MSVVHEGRLSWPLPCVLALASGLSALLAVAVALPMSPARGYGGLRARPPDRTPESTAENFVMAYLQGDLDAAGRLADTDLRRALQRTRARASNPTRPDAKSHAFVIEESHTLTRRRLRLVGMLVSAEQPEAAGWPIELVVSRHDARFLVDDIIWPRGPLPSSP